MPAGVRALTARVHVRSCDKYRRPPDEPDRRSAARRQHRARPRRRRPSRACSKRRAQLVRRERRAGRGRVVVEASPRAKTRVHRTRPGHRDSAWPHQAASRRRSGAFAAAEDGRFPSMLPTASRCRRYSCCWCRNRPPTCTCNCLSELAQMFSGKRVSRQARRRDQRRRTRRSCFREWRADTQ